MRENDRVKLFPNFSFKEREMKSLAFLTVSGLVAFPENFLDPCDFQVTQDLAVKKWSRRPRAATSGKQKH